MAALSGTARTCLDTALADPAVGKEVADAIDGGTGHPQSALIVANSFSATTGSLPTPDGTTLFANTATPTVVELLDAVVELRAKLVLIIAALHNYGVTL